VARAAGRLALLGERDHHGATGRNGRADRLCEGHERPVEAEAAGGSASTERAAFPAAGPERHRLRDLHARPRRPRRELERGCGADQRVQSGGDPGEAVLHLLPARRRGCGEAGVRAERGLAGRPVRGPGLEGPQGRLALLGERGDHRAQERGGRADRVREGDAGPDGAAQGRAPCHRGCEARRCCGNGEPGEERVPGGDVPRAAHAVERDQRLHGSLAARDPRPAHGPAARCAGADPEEPAAPPGVDHGFAELQPDRGGSHHVPPRAGAAGGGRAGGGGGGRGPGRGGGKTAGGGGAGGARARSRCGR